MTHANPGPNYFIKVQLYTVLKNVQNQDKRSKNITHPAVLKGNKIYLQ